jgi:hypothetical protein
MTTHPTSPPYLILHKVRGESAFDIAVKMTVEALGEEWWIIPTSGHRAYPYFNQPLAEIIQEDLNDPEIPSDWPDHYQVTSEPKAKNILDKIVSALTGPKEKLNRRV